MKTSTVISIFIFFIIFTTSAFADSKSDFEYQHSKYREHISEFLIFKKDYLDTPSLDNQQKALLTAKLAIKARDLTKASFAAYINDLIQHGNLSYSPLVPVRQMLLESQQFFLGESAKSQNIVTTTNLHDFDDYYSKNFPKHEQSIKIGIVAQKIAKLKFLSIQLEKSFTELKTKLPINVSVRVTERVSSLDTDLKIITEKVDAMAEYLVSEENLGNSESEIFFSSKVEQLSEIRQLQLNFIDQLIDLDLNYGKI